MILRESENTVEGLARAALHCAMEAQRQRVRLSWNTIESAIWQRAPKLFAKVKQHVDFKAAMLML